MEIKYSINERIYLPFIIKEIHVNSKGGVTYTLEAKAPFMYYSQTGIYQEDIDIYGLSHRDMEKRKNEKDI